MDASPRGISDSVVPLRTVVLGTPADFGKLIAQETEKETEKMG